MFIVEGLYLKVQIQNIALFNLLKAPTPSRCRSRPNCAEYMTNIIKHDFGSTYFSQLEFFEIRLCVRGSRRSERSIDSLKAGLHVAQVISNFYWLLFRTIFHFFRKRRLTLHFHCSVSSSTAFLLTRATGAQMGDTSQFPRLTYKWV